jgi:hypothetical protein
MDALLSFNPQGLLHAMLASLNCRHNWSEPICRQQRWIVCQKCGLKAFVYEAGLESLTASRADDPKQASLTGSARAGRGHGLAEYPKLGGG